MGSLGILLGLDPEAKASRGLGGNGCPVVCPNASFDLNHHIWQMGEVTSLVKMAELGSPRLVLTEPRGVVGGLGCFYLLCSRERASCSFVSF